mmetsp:Transcript_44191/g.137614  ORF Transcript_44191/g.137614 Transcript_44191/m.137614 type:complete len:404 (+) Transcript_44191:1086-2297(+)
MVYGIDVGASRAQNRQLPSLESDGHLPSVHRDDLLRPQHYGLFRRVDEGHKLEVGGVDEVRAGVLDQHRLVVEPRQGDLALLHPEARDRSVSDLCVKQALRAYVLQGRRVVDVHALGQQPGEVALKHEAGLALRHLDDVDGPVVDVRVDDLHEALVLEDRVVHRVCALREKLRAGLLGNHPKGASRHADDVVRHVLHVQGVHGLELHEAEERVVVDVETLLQQHWLAIFHGQTQLPPAHAHHREGALGDDVLCQALFPAAGGKQLQVPLHGPSARTRNADQPVVVDDHDLACLDKPAPRHVPDGPRRRSPLVCSLEDRSRVVVICVWGPDDALDGAVVVNCEELQHAGKLVLVRSRPFGQTHVAQAGLVDGVLVALFELEGLHGAARAMQAPRSTMRRSVKNT